MKRTMWKLITALSICAAISSPAGLAADQAQCQTYSAGAAKTTGGTIQNAGQAIVGLSSGGGVNAHAGAIPCLSGAVVNACTAVITSDPPNCEVDARQPHDVNNAVPALGLTSIAMTFNGGCLAGTFAAADFSVSVSPGPAPLPGISSVTGLGSVATINFNMPLPVGNWTCVTHIDTGAETCVGYLPADVNASKVSNAQDITALINSLNNVPGTVRPLFATDMNRSGVANAQDITRLIDLLNGASAFNPWVNAALPACPSAAP